MRGRGPGLEGDEMSSPAEGMNRFWRALLGHPMVLGNAGGLWHPIVDVYDKGKEIVVHMELPGMKGQRMEVSLDEDHLIVEGDRPRPVGFSEDEGYYCERPAGRFHRVIHLPCSVDEERISACYDDGVLVVTLPKAGKEGTRRVNVTWA